MSSKFISNIVPYLGVQEKNGRADAPLAESIVMKLAEHVTRKGYNMFCDNFFTSLPLAQKLANTKSPLLGQ